MFMAGTVVSDTTSYSLRPGIHRQTGFGCRDGYASARQINAEALGLLTLAALMLHLLDLLRHLGVGATGWCGLRGEHDSKAADCAQGCHQR
jgi:hypothetical protein